MTNARIFVIDDDEDLRETIGLMLGDEGFEVFAFASAREAIRRIEGGQPADVILLDLMMPDMNGWEFCQHRVTSAVLAKVPVIVITARRSFAPPLGISDIVHKPFGPDDLLQSIARSMAESAVANDHRR